MNWWATYFISLILNIHLIKLNINLYTLCSKGYPGYSEEGTPMGTEVKDMAKYWRERRFALADIGDESWGCKASGVNGADFESKFKIWLESEDHKNVCFFLKSKYFRTNQTDTDKK